jgi:hypothetical protein
VTVPWDVSFVGLLPFVSSVPFLFRCLSFSRRPGCLLPSPSLVEPEPEQAWNGKAEGRRGPECGRPANSKITSSKIARLETEVVLQSALCVCAYRKVKVRPVCYMYMQSSMASVNGGSWRCALPDYGGEWCWTHTHTHTRKIAQFDHRQPPICSRRQSI